MSGYDLAPVQENDLTMMARIHAVSFDDAWSAAMIRRILSMPGSFGLVARRNRQWSVAGFALVRGVADEGELLSLAVASDQRGRGVGSLLLAGVIQQSHAAGARKLFLEVAEDNFVARDLYDGFGFVPVGRRPDYYVRADGSKASAVTMSYDLTAAVAEARA